MKRQLKNKLRDVVATIHNGKRIMRPKRLADPEALLSGAEAAARIAPENSQRAFQACTAPLTQDEILRVASRARIQQESPPPCTSPKVSQTKRTMMRRTVLFAGRDFPSLFEEDTLTTGRRRFVNLFDPESLLTGAEDAAGMTYSNSRRCWPDQQTYWQAVSGQLTSDEIARIAPRSRVQTARIEKTKGQRS